MIAQPQANTTDIIYPDSDERPMADNTKTVSDGLSPSKKT